jgi:8-oxoguanine deaminase
MTNNQTSLIVKNIDYLATMDQSKPMIENGWIAIKDGQITALGGPDQPAPMAQQTIDARGHIVIPGLVNTHHHFFQTLLRAVPSIQDKILFYWLKELYFMMGSLTDEMVYVSSMIALAELMLSGCTTAQDHFYLGVNDTAFDTEIAAAQRMGMRFHLSRGSFSVGQSQGGLPPDEIIETEDAILADCERLAKTYHDQARFGMTRMEFAPCSPFSVSAELMKESARIARQYGVGLHTHLAETKDEEVYCLENFGLRPVEYMQSLGWVGPDTWFAHAVHLNEAEIKILAETGTGISHCPSSNARLGSGIAPIKSMLGQGVNVSLGVDGSASNDSSHLLAEARMAMLFQRALHGADAMNAQQALEIATVQGARVLGRDDIAVLKPGMAADFVGYKLDQLAFAGALHDPLAALVFCTPSEVSFSVINGQTRVWESKIIGLELEPLIARHNQLSKILVSQAEEQYGMNFSKQAWKT